MFESLWGGHSKARLCPSPPRWQSSVDNEIWKLGGTQFSILSSAESQQKQLEENPGSAGDAPSPAPKVASTVIPVSGYETGEARSTAATTGQDVATGQDVVSVISSKYESLTFSICFSLLPVYMVFLSFYVLNSTIF